jgi:hypothetical protein
MSGVIASLALSVGTSAYSFAGAMKSKRLQRESQLDAERAMAEAKKRLEINVYEKLGIAKLPYEQAREAALVQGAMATEAARESERGSAAAAGRIQMAQAQEQQTVRAAQEQEMMNLNKLVAEEEGRLLDIGTQLNLEEVAGAQQAARDYEEQANRRIFQGIETASDSIKAGIQMAPLYNKSGVVKYEGMLREQYEGRAKDYLAAKGTPNEKNYKMSPEFLDASGNPLPFQAALSKMQGAGGWNFAGVETMNPADYTKWLLSQRKKTFKDIYQSNVPNF